jgi:thiol-disulfide isomerase/thioredoxin
MIADKAYKSRGPLLIFAVAAIVLAGVACGSDDPAAAAATATTPTRSGLEITGVTEWINSDPISIRETLDQNKVVLVDFWTYTCVNCLRTLPFLREWNQKYADHGLVILGVHSPEFEFEKVLANVQAAVDAEMITWPVALDSDMATWNAFNNRYWPAKYLIKPTGGLTYTHFGEGSYVETEEEIRDALVAAGWDISGIPIGTVDNLRRDPVADRITREIYGGYERSYHSQGIYSGDEEYYAGPDRTVVYEDDGEYRPQQFFLQGEWTNTAEAIVHARATGDPVDYIALLMVARSANVVVQPQGPEPFRVYVTLDDMPLTRDEAGADIQFDEEQRSYFEVTEARMYRIVEQPEFKERLLKLSSTSDNFAIFAFTFGVYDSGA